MKINMENIFYSLFKKYRKRHICGIFLFLLVNIYWAQVQKLPLTEDFEGTTHGFTLVNGRRQVNKWFVGTAVNNGGAKSLYVSDKAGGDTNTYGTSDGSVTHAYIDIVKPSDVSNISVAFDWGAEGEATSDYLDVWMVPTDYTPRAGVKINGVGINIGTFSGSNTFTKSIGTYNFSAIAGAKMRLVFSWINNDNGTGTQKPAAIDNIFINSCSPGAMYINNVKFLGTLTDNTNNDSFYDGVGPNVSDGIADYTSLLDKGKQVPGGGINVFVETKSSVLNYLGSSIEAWVDWDNSGTYAGGEKVYSTSSQAESTTFGFVVPTTTSPGTYKIKITSTLTPKSSSNQSCVGSTFTETEIYSFIVISNNNVIITGKTDGKTCGTGPVTLSATGNGVSYRWYTQEFGGTAIPFATSSTYTTASISSTTSYYVTAVDTSGTESVYRTEVLAKYYPTTNLTLSADNKDICGESNGILITAQGDKEEYQFFLEDFETVPYPNATQPNILSRFRASTINNNNTAGNSTRTQWQIQQSTYTPNISTWKPAISSGQGTNKFAFATSDIGASAEPDKVETDLRLDTSLDPNSLNMLNLYVSFNLYYSWYGNQNANTKDNLFIEVSTDGGTNWVTSTVVSPDINIKISKDNGLTWYNSNIIDYRWGNGTRFESLLVDLSYYKNQSNLRFRFRYKCGWGDGLAIDNIRVYGDRPLVTPFSWSNSNMNFYKSSDCSTLLKNTDKESTVCIKPTLDQIQNNDTWSIEASGNLFNGCSATGSFTISNSTKVWNHATNDWGVTNWKPSSPLPDITKCVIIRTPVELPSGTNGTHGSAKNVVVKSGGKLTIKPKSSLTIQNFLKNEAAASDVLVESDANLKQNDNNAANEGSIKVLRNANLQRLDYNYWGSPVTGQSFYQFSPNTKPNRFYTYDPRDDSFVTIANLNDTFLPAKGYAILSPNNYTSTPQIFPGTFIGKPNNGNISIALDYSPHPTTGVYGGNNMVSNPYPSNINLRQLTTKNSTITNGLYYFWTNDARSFQNNVTAIYGIYGNYKVNQYAILNQLGSTPATGPATASSKMPSNIVKPGQGFIIQAKAPGNLIFDNSVRTILTKDGAGRDAVFFNRTSGNNKSVSKSSSVLGKYWVSLISPVGAKSVALVGYVDDASNDYDLVYDAPIAMSSSDNFYTISDTKKLAIQGRNSSDVINDRVMLGMSNFIAGTYTIMLENKEGIFDNNQAIYIKDNSTGIIKEITSTEGYTFSADSGVIDGRFEIVYQNESSLLTDELKKNDILVYRDAGFFVIKSPSVIENIEMYDTSGKLIYTNRSVNNKDFRININALNDGIYLIKFSNKDGVKTRKVIK